MANINGEGGCVLGTCEFELTGEGNSTLLITEIEYGAINSNYTDHCVSPSIGVMTKLALGNLPVATDTSVSNVETNFDSFLVGGIIVFVVGALASWITSAAFIVWFRRQHNKVYQQLLPQVYSGGEDNQIREETPAKLAVRKQNITINHTVDEEKEYELRVVPFTPAETSEGEQ
eukprot:GILJ01027373.1.p2 GENE.GILJ01027373.1~~GILJ01027373.1.p2  ORF type:complete len:174 (+),score=16.39 GILJ01027373.1:1018-1539(+)